MLYPLTFHPIFKERIWGGRNLETLYGKPIPPAKRIGESWEISDRPEGVSLIANGPLAGRDLRWLMENHERELLGSATPSGGRFPLLIKILDAADKLSLQVHPPKDVAVQLGGEPKTEMWYIAHATAGAELYVGLKAGVTRAQFEKQVRDGTVAECFHRIPVQRGDAMFLPSGRVHAIGAGLVIFEIQQNSDTTYRVFDWNRRDEQGKPRDLHIPQSLASIDFNDFEPRLIENEFVKNARILVSDSLFAVEEQRLLAGTEFSIARQGMTMLAILNGTVLVQAAGEELKLAPGQFCLLPACLDRWRLKTERDASFLKVTA